MERAGHHADQFARCSVSQPAVSGEACLPGQQRARDPLPVIDRIETAPHEHAWDTVQLENELIRVMILPEIGGRIPVGQDKVNGYDFFYRGLRKLYFAAESGGLSVFR